MLAIYDKFAGSRRLGENSEQHSLLSTLLSGGDYNQWKKENERTIEEQEELDRNLETQIPDYLQTLDVVIINCIFEVCMACPTFWMISLQFIVSC